MFAIFGHRCDCGLGWFYYLTSRRRLEGWALAD